MGQQSISDQINSKEDLLNQGFSFCIITAGARLDKLNTLISSIRNQQLKKFEIIVVGNLPIEIDGIMYLALVDQAASGQVAVMRNTAMKQAAYETIVMCDDDIILDHGFADAVASHGKVFDMLCVRMRNPDGSRCWDWATTGGPSGHRLMSYDENDEHVYVSSGIFVIRKKTLQLGYFAEHLGFYQGEDVEFSQRLKSKGAIIDFCSAAGAVHDDPNYTQFDDYPRRIIDFQQWETLTPEVRVRGAYVWDGKAYPVIEDLLINVTNNQLFSASIEFNLLPVERELYSTEWKCCLIHNGVTLKESQDYGLFNFAIQLEAGESRTFNLKSNDCAVAFTKGVFRDQRAIAAFLVKPVLREVREGDLLLEQAQVFNPLSSIDKSGIAVFAPCMNFGDFSVSARAMIRDFALQGIDFGLDLHSVDFWFSQLCFGISSSQLEWTKYIKYRKYAGINLVCADSESAVPGFFRRAISSRPRFTSNIAVTDRITDPRVLEELNGYDQVFTYDHLNCQYLKSAGLKVDLIKVSSYFNQSKIQNFRRLSNQRSQAVAVLLDRFSNFEAEFTILLQQFKSDQDISLVLYVIDSYQVLQHTMQKVQNLLEKLGQQDRISQVLVSCGTLEAVEELEFLKSAIKIVNLLSVNLALKLDLRLSLSV